MTKPVMAKSPCDEAIQAPKGAARLDCHRNGGMLAKASIQRAGHGGMLFWLPARVAGLLGQFRTAHWILGVASVTGGRNR
jgi:hypothetical protein